MVREMVNSYCSPDTIGSIGLSTNGVLNEFLEQRLALTKERIFKPRIRRSLLCTMDEALRFPNDMKCQYVKCLFNHLVARERV